MFIDDVAQISPKLCRSEMCGNLIYAAPTELDCLINSRCYKHPAPPEPNNYRDLLRIKAQPLSC